MGWNWVNVVEFLYTDILFASIYCVSLIYTSPTPRQGRGTDRLVPGHALVMQPEKGFQGLASFGNNFLSKFEGVEVEADILRNITIIDTPGVLSGEKQRIGRDYDYAEVVKWFAERADMIVVMFDAHKLDISDELKTVLDTLKPHHEKIRILLNKVTLHVVDIILCDCVTLVLKPIFFLIDVSASVVQSQLCCLTKTLCVT